MPFIRITWVSQYRGTRRANHPRFYWNKIWQGGSGISWTICKSFAPHMMQLSARSSLRRSRRQFRGFGVLTPPIFPISIGLAGRLYNNVSTTVLHCGLMAFKDLQCKGLPYGSGPVLNFRKSTGKSLPNIKIWTFSMTLLFSLPTFQTVQIYRNWPKLAHSVLGRPKHPARPVVISKLLGLARPVQGSTMHCQGSHSFG